MPSGGKASGRGRGHYWSRGRDDCNGDDEPPVSCSDWQGWQEGWRKEYSVSHRNWESGNTWQHNPTSGSDWQSSSTWQHNPASGSASRSSNQWQRSQPAVAAAVDTNAPDTMDWSGCASQSSNQWQRSQPAVAAAVDTNAPARAPLGPWPSYKRTSDGGSNARKGYDEHGHQQTWNWLERVNDDINEEDSIWARSTRVQQDIINEWSTRGQQDIINEERRRDSGHQRGSQRAQAAAHAGREHNDTRGAAARAQTVRDTGGAPMASHRWWRTHAEYDISSICRGAIASEIAAAHANECPIPDAVGRDAAFFKAYQVNVHYSKHNDALKNFREDAERGELEATRGRRAFGVGQAHDIRRLVRKQSGGEDFLFETRDGGLTAWIWESMIAHLDDASIDFVVNGTSTPDKSAVATSPHASGACDMTASANAESTAPWDVHGNSQQTGHPTCAAIVPYSPRTRAIVGCEFVMDTNRVDHKRHSAAKRASSRTCQPWPEEKRLYRWAFMIKRDDGTVCLLEPHSTDTKVDMYEGVSAMHLPVPRNGLGGADFKGDYRRRISHNVARTLRFDVKKSPSEARRNDVIVSDEQFDAMARCAAGVTHEV